MNAWHRCGRRLGPPAHMPPCSHTTTPLQARRAKTAHSSDYALHRGRALSIEGSCACRVGWPSAYLKNSTFCCAKNSRKRLHSRL